LSETLSRIQRSIPYLVSWQVFPLSQFDVGLVYHSVAHFCQTPGRWIPIATGLLINVARQLHKPLCRLELDGVVTSHPSLELSHELLAEAQVAFFRGLLRTTVLNSYQAVESFANHIFKEKKTAALIAEGKSATAAEDEAEQLRKQKRLDIKFLTNHGLKAASGDSLLQHNQKIHEALCELKELRNQVAHAGRKPVQNEAEDGYALCCDVMRWLSGVGGYPVRALLPDISNLKAVPQLRRSCLASAIDRVPRFAWKCDDHLCGITGFLSRRASARTRRPDRSVGRSAGTSIRTGR
jgi:hypothetical protein